MGAGYVVGDETQLTAGGGQVLIDGYDIGYCKGKIGMSREVENLIVKTGIPKSTILQLLLGEDYKLEIPIIQVGNIDNLGRVLNIAPNAEAGNEVTVGMGATGAGLLSGISTFAPRNGSDVSYIQLGPNLTNLVMKDATETTTYDLNDDYFVVDAATGLVVRNPGSAFAIGATVHHSHKFTPVAYSELLLGKVAAIINYKVEYLHISPAGGWLLHYCFWKCQGDGSVDLSLDTEGGDVMVALSKMVAKNDEANHPTSATQGPTGFIRFVPQALVSAYLATVTVN